MIDAPASLPDGAAGVDAGLTLTKVAIAEADRMHLYAMRTDALDSLAELRAAPLAGVTGARGPVLGMSEARVSQEIDAAARGVRALSGSEDDTVLTLLGTGTAFAAMRGARVTHLGGAAMGGGSFAAIARAVHPTLTYGAMLAAAARGDRTRADLMVSDAYPEGIGRIGPDMTAAHLSKPGGSLDDFLAALLNMHGESIAQIGAQRALLQQITRLALCGGFVHQNQPLADSVTFMAGLFGVKVDVVRQPGFAGAIGALLLAVES
jgi:type II pantothenate kinase